MLRLSGITKQFGAVQALRGVSLDLHADEVHALLGENGAGKSTLMNILSGLTVPDAGTIELDGRALRFASPVAARRAGIGMVHQHFTLIDSLTVAENLVLSLPDRPRFRLSLAQIAQQATALAQQLALDIGDPHAIIGELPVGTRQRIEILKALAADARILILDEPTAVLTRTETEQLFVLLRALRARGCAIVFITHKLREVAEVADRVTVLRRGEVVATCSPQESSESHLAELMIGAPAPSPRPRSAPPTTASAILQVRDLVVGTGRTPSLNGISFEVRAGEVFGIAGVSGNGQQELFECLVGLQSPRRGEIRLDGRAVDTTSPRTAMDAGIGSIPPDRHQQGLALSMSLADNALLNARILDRFRVGWRLRHSDARVFAAELVQRYAVHADSIDTPAAALSGGNQQRVIIGRQLAAEPRVLIAVDPTRGLDVAAAQTVYRALDAFVAEGNAVVLIASDLDEVLDLCHRFAVLFGGRLSAPLSPSVEPELVGRLMAGAAA